MILNPVSDSGKSEASQVNLSNKYAIMTRTGAIRTQIPSSKLKLQIVKIQREQIVNQVSSSFPKGGHSATKPVHYLCDASHENARSKQPDR